MIVITDWQQIKNGTKKVKANTFLNLAKRKKEKSTSNQIIFSKHKQDQTNIKRALLDQSAEKWR